MSGDPVGGPPIIWSIPVMTIPPEEPLDTGVLQGGFELEDPSDTYTSPPITVTLDPDLNTSSPFDSPAFINCTDALQHVAWADPSLISSLIILVAINGLVVAGNVLVILAVFTTPKLRTVTNLFIASLAVADLMLGMAVLPFSVTVEVFHTWLFGELWCSVWLAVDVWMSTASILNLCVISLDRYVAVTRPVKYPSLMTSKRAKILIACVWVASFVICFPPLVGWNDKHKNLAASDTDCVLTCELTNDIGYVLYSAMGSFFIPMLVMMFFYWKIYLAAVETTRAINRGFRTTKGRTQQFDEEKVTLRIHVGRNNSLQGQERSAAAAKARRFSSVKLPGGRRKDTSGSDKKSKFFKETSRFSPPKQKSAGAKRDGLELLSLGSSKAAKKGCTRSESSLSMDLGLSMNSSPRHSSSQTSKEGDCDNGSLATRSRGTSKMGKRNIKMQVKRFKMETKAAKTLGIIVGVFIICWFPFFTMYLVRAFCLDCIHPLLFSVFFWLGYCNSAINPCIYAMFSKDFRFAFKRILCKCLCRRERRKWPLPMPSLYLPSLGDESDENFEDRK